MRPPDFPVLDSARENTEGRLVFDEYGSLEPYVDEIDTWFDMPVRLALTAGAGLVLELGPYTLDHEEIQLLRKAIAEYDKVKATERTL